MVAALGARHPCRAGAIDDIQFQFPSSDNLAQAIGSQLGSDLLRLALGPRSAFWGVVADQPKHGVICPNSISIDDFDVRSRNRIDRQDFGTGHRSRRSVGVATTVQSGGEPRTARAHHPTCHASGGPSEPPRLDPQGCTRACHDCCYVGCSEEARFRRNRG